VQAVSLPPAPVWQVAKSVRPPLRAPTRAKVANKPRGSHRTQVNKGAGSPKKRTGKEVRVLGVLGMAAVLAARCLSSTASLPRSPSVRKRAGWLRASSGLAPGCVRAVPGLDTLCHPCGKWLRVCDGSAGRAEPQEGQELRNCRSCRRCQ
jgi:hypothetical protein